MPSAPLYQLVYRSVAAGPLPTEQLRELLRNARSYNHQARVSGLLLFVEGRFLQVLEGEPAEVQRLFAHIRRDPRHTAVEVVSEGPVARRAFPDWSMGFAEEGAAGTTYLVGYVDAGRTDFLLPRAHNLPAPLLAQVARFAGLVPPVAARAAAPPGG